MKFNLRHYLFRALISYVILVGLLAISLNGQEKEQPKSPADAENVKAWKLPGYMHENLQWMLKDFNKRFQEKIDSYEKELKIRFEEFKDMPEDVVLDIETGIFIKRSDYLKLQEQLRRKILEEQIKKEVKKNEKQTN